jgi:hypothetical protein
MPLMQGTDEGGGTDTESESIAQVHRTNFTAWNRL